MLTAAIRSKPRTARRLTETALVSFRQPSRPHRSPCPAGPGSPDLSGARSPPGLRPRRSAGRRSGSGSSRHFAARRATGWGRCCPAGCFPWRGVLNILRRFQITPPSLRRSHAPTRSMLRSDFGPESKPPRPLERGGGEQNVKGRSAVALALGRAFPLRYILGDHARGLNGGLAEMGIARDFALHALALDMQPFTQALELGNQVGDLGERGSGHPLDQRIQVVDGRLAIRLGAGLGAHPIGDVVANELAHAGLDLGGGGDAVLRLGLGLVNLFRTHDTHGFIPFFGSWRVYSRTAIVLGSHQEV